MNWYLKVLNQYADFSGRARRTEYWMFILFNLIIGIVLQYGLALISPPLSVGVSALYGLAVFIPSLAVVVRRLHDIGKSGWMILINLIPIVGFIWFFVLLVSNGQVGSNQYGADPKE